MQGTNQVPGTRKRLEEVKHIRDTMANGDSVLTDEEVRQIRQQATLLGEDGDVL